jgi:uncharacterized protein
MASTAAVTTQVDLALVAQSLQLQSQQVANVVALLDQGNTIPFVTRYRKDHTGGLDEEQIRRIQAHVERLRLLAQRKQVVLRSIEAQGKLTPELRAQIQAADTVRTVEDLYLPFKPKKQTLALLARERGLEPLALEILAGQCLDLDARAADFVNPDKQVRTAAEALLGAGHILAEMFSERADARGRLREVIASTGRLTTVRVAEEPPGPARKKKRKSRRKSPRAAAPQGDSSVQVGSAASSAPRRDADSTTPDGNSDAAASGGVSSTDVHRSGPAPAAADHPASHALPGDSPGRGAGQGTSTASTADEAPGHGAATDRTNPSGGSSAAHGSSPRGDDYEQEQPSPLQQSGPHPGDQRASPPESDPVSPGRPESSGTSAPGPLPEPCPVPEPSAGNAPGAAAAPSSADEPPRVAAADAPPEAAGAAAPSATETPPAPAAADSPPASDAPAAAAAVPPSAAAPAAQRRAARRSARSARSGALPRGIQDVLSYSEPLNKVPPHRVLAINRGERLKLLRVRIAVDEEQLHRVAQEAFVPPGHPQAEFLRGCARDAVERLIFPSLEREFRRELTEAAEKQALHVFAQNLRNLLLRPPVRHRRVLAIDPGYRSGCKVACLDEFGNYLDSSVVYVTGKDDRRPAAKARLIELITLHGIQVIAIGNGTACREAEALVAETIASPELADRDLAYVIVNEAGASVYSTSTVGREEFPDFDPTVRSAISIGRRLQDPLSELVKIEPGHIGVGMYQHDMKARHLREQLDEVVQSCVNYVGVNLNTASVPLLRYVSGLNQLTARRIFEYRQEHGPFQSREQLKDVPGIGESAYVQAAGFLRIPDGIQPLDATWIHPESYPLAERILQRLGFAPQQLADKDAAARIAQAARDADPAALACELGAGVLTTRDILQQLCRPGRDPREDLPPPVFKRGILRLEDLQPGMELSGHVLNVVDFGAFVDVGLKDSGLVHVSQMATRFVSDPHNVVAVGDIVRVWVLDVDVARRRVSLTMIPPGTPRHGSRGPGRRSPAAAAEPPPSSAPAATPAAPAAEAEGRPAPRPPQRGHGGRRRAASAPAAARPPRPEKPPPPVKLTRKMKEGKEPLRTFGQLQEFLRQRQQPPEDRPQQ